MKAKEILEKYRRAPISTMTSEGTIYSVDLALSELRGMVMGMKYDETISSAKVGREEIMRMRGYNQAVETIANELFGVK